MKKVIVLILSLTFVLALAGCGKTTGSGAPVRGGADMPTVENDGVIQTEQTQPAQMEIPSMSEVSQMGYEEVNEILSGRTINELRGAWGDPIDSDENGDSWQVDSSMIITVKYDVSTNSGIVESCELICGTPLAPTE